MAVYTKIDRAQLEEFLASYDLGALSSFEGIQQGVENTNYHVFTDKGRYVLTLFEKRVKAEDLPFFLSFGAHLAAKGISCPRALSDKRGQTLRQLAERPCAVINFLEGRTVCEADIKTAHCKALGAVTARLHNAAADFPGVRENALSLSGWKTLAAKTVARADGVSPGLARLIEDELSFLGACWPALSLPRAVVHADIFPDNVFFDDADNVSGVIDFYFSCNDFLAYDLSIVVNAWCFNPAHEFERARYDALMSEYESVRALSMAEKESFNLLCRGSSLRFLLTRLHDWIFHDPASFVRPKDPLEYLAKLEFHRSEALA